MPQPEMRLLREPIARHELQAIAEAGFGDLVKAVVDLGRGVMAIGGELHSDEEALLLDDGAVQQELWGINLYPAEPDSGWIEYDAMITGDPRHPDLAAGRWHTLPIVEQLANVGSEVDRAIRAHRAGRVDRRDQAMRRALELFDLTAADERWRGHRRREVLRAREYFCRLFFDPTIETDADRFMERYLLAYAVAARRLGRFR